MPRYRFGAFELDSEARTLQCDGASTPINGRTLDVLTLLVQNRGRLIDKDELLSRIWAGSVVEESNLTHCIFALRKVLGDSPKDHRYIATVAGRGYQFVAPVTESTVGMWQKSGSRNRILQLGAVGTLLILALVVWDVQHSGRRVSPEPRISHFTSDPGAETMPAFSPDGKQIAYVRAEHEPADFMQGQVGQANIYTKLIGAATELRLTDHPGADYFPAWSPDGQYIAYYRDEREASGIYIVSALGGHERRITAEKVGDGGIQWLPNGHLVASPPLQDSERPAALIEISPDSSAERQITFPPSGAPGDGSPAISADGRTLAFLRLTKSEGVHACFLQLSDRRAARCWPLDGTWPEGLTWAASGNGIVVSIMRKGGGHRLWRYDLKGGTPVALTLGEEEAVSPAVSNQGTQLAYVLSRRNINLWQEDIAPSSLSGRGNAKPISPSTRYEIDPAFSPDGRKVAFMSDRSGSQEIWVTDLETRNSTQLTQIGGVLTGSPSWSPDGLQIAFDSAQGGSNIFIVAADGGALRRVTNVPGENCCPSWSADGRFVYFASDRSGKFQIWKAFASTGETSSKAAVQITQGGGFRAAESADGKYLYYARDGKPGLWRRSLVPPSREEPVLKALQDTGWWALGPGSVYFFDLPESMNSRVRLKVFDTANHSTRELAVLPYPTIRGTPALAVSKDERHLVYIQIASMEADIMLMENFR